MNSRSVKRSNASSFFASSFGFTPSDRNCRSAKRSSASVCAVLETLERFKFFAKSCNALRWQYKIELVIVLQEPFGHSARVGTVCNSLRFATPHQTDVHQVAYCREGNPQQGMPIRAGLVGRRGQHSVTMVIKS